MSKNQQMDFRIQCNTNRGSFTTSTSTSTTPSSQECDHSDHPAIESSESVDGQARRNQHISET